jgi:hypothetical protein
VGTTARFCANDAVVEADCTEDRADGNCAIFSVGYGADCGVPAGTECFNADTEFQSLCIGTNPGCKTNATVTAGTCIENGPQCSNTDEGTCIDSKFIFLCGAVLAETDTDGQTLFQDCADVAGSTCTAALGCVTPAGAACVAGSLCADTENVCPPSGTCDGSNPLPTEGEGEGEGEEGEGEGEGEDPPPPAPGCFGNALGMVPAFGPLALGLLALRLRRRQA